MLFRLLLGTELRLWVGCQVWSLWQPGNPDLGSIPAASSPAHRMKRKIRSC